MSDCPRYGTWHTLWATCPTVACTAADTRSRSYTNIMPGRGTRALLLTASINGPRPLPSRLDTWRAEGSERTNGGASHRRPRVRPDHQVEPELSRSGRTRGVLRRT